MFRSAIVALGFSLCFCCVAGAQPQTLSFFMASCGGAPCDFAPSLPPQGFVLTDLLSLSSSGANIGIKEVSGPDEITKLQVSFGPGSGVPLSYHLNSGIPFAGGSTLRIAGNIVSLTLVGYIPGTASASVPAVGNFGLGVMLLTILGVGGVLFRKIRLTR